LSSHLKGYAPAVIESMAVGVPVVAWDVPHRPANRAMFVPNQEIRLFDGEDARSLAGHLRALQSDQPLARAQALAAGRVVARHHTIEARVAGVLDWIGSGAAEVPACVDPVRAMRRVARRSISDCSTPTTPATV
jgi:glycosyltransferase involved in cell wall biosynthesis